MRFVSSAVGARSSIADHVLARGRRADERCDVRRDAFLDQGLQVFAQRVPADVETDVALRLEHLFADAVVDRTHRIAFAEDFERDTLLDVAHAAAVVEQRFGGPGERVDEAGRDCEPVGIHFAGRAVVAQSAHRDDATVAHGDVAANRCAAATVVDRPVANQQIDSFGSVHAAGERRQQYKAKQPRTRQKTSAHSSPFRSASSGSERAL